jgi:preprotein translocase subunit Sss1
MKLTHKKNGEIYVEWKNIADLLATGILLVGGILFAIASFYSFWILLELMR